MLDKNNKELKTGDIVKIEGGYFKADNGTFLVVHSPGDPSWSGSDYSLRKCNKKGVESEAKYATAFWPLMITVNSREKYYAAKAHNAEHATIEIIGSVKVYKLIVRQQIGYNTYETKEIATEKRYAELLTYKYTEIEVVNEHKEEIEAAAEPVEDPAPVEVAEPSRELAESPEPVNPIEESEPQEEAPAASLINEDLARQAKENMSFSDYNPGSATAEYNAEIARITELVEAAKLKVSDEGKAKLDHFLSSYKVRYANWINKYNSNGSRHVSVMIAGPSNYNMRAHERYMSREGKLWEEYEEFKNPEYKISSIVSGDKVIRTEDKNAIEKLEAKIAGLEKSQELMKTANAIIRKKALTDQQKIAAMVEIGLTEENAREALKPDFCGRVGFPSYSLQNNNANIRTAKQRLEHIKKLRAQENKEIIVESEESDAVRIIDNAQANRLQIFFPGKPDANIRTELKRNGFRWAPSIGAWQSYRSIRANQAAQKIVSNY